MDDESEWGKGMIWEIYLEGVCIIDSLAFRRKSAEPPRPLSILEARMSVIMEKRNEVTDRDPNAFVEFA